MAAVKTSNQQPKETNDTNNEQWNSTYYQEMLKSSYRAGSLCNRTGITVEDRDRQPGKGKGFEKGKVKKNSTSNLPPYSVDFFYHHAT